MADGGRPPDALQTDKMGQEPQRDALLERAPWMQNQSLRAYLEAVPVHETPPPAAQFECPAEAVITPEVAIAPEVVIAPEVMIAPEIRYKLLELVDILRAAETENATLLRRAAAMIPVVPSVVLPDFTVPVPLVAPEWNAPPPAAPESLARPRLRRGRKKRKDAVTMTEEGPPHAQAGAPAWASSLEMRHFLLQQIAVFEGAYRNIHTYLALLLERCDRLAAAAAAPLRPAGPPAGEPLFYPPPAGPPAGGDYPPDRCSPPLFALTPPFSFSPLHAAAFSVDLGAPVASAAAALGGPAADLLATPADTPPLVPVTNVASIATGVVVGPPIQSAAASTTTTTMRKASSPADWPGGLFGDHPQPPPVTPVAPYLARRPPRA